MTIHFHGVFISGKNKELSFFGLWAYDICKRWNNATSITLYFEYWYNFFSINFSGETHRRVDENEKCSRTFVTFTDERTFRDYFSQKKRKVPSKQFCPVTKLPAKYYDPVTQTPFANLQAFKCIREAYAQQLAEEANQRKK